MHISVRPTTVFVKLLLVTALLLCAHSIGLIFKFIVGHDYVLGFVPMFNFDTEKNVPSFFSSALLLIVSLLLFQISVIRKKMSESFLPWLGLALIFIFLSADEFFSLHERLTKPVEGALQTSGAFTFAWVVPYSLLLIFFLVVYGRFLFRLPKPTMLLFILSGAVYVMGALGFEFIGGAYAESYGIENIGYALLTTVEELLEMLGLILFIYTLLTYLVKELKTSRLSMGQNHLVLKLN